MAITRVQNQTNFTQKPVIEPQGNLAMERLVQIPKMHYRNCTDIPDSVNNIRPERGQGHLIGNNPIKALGRFFSNRYYDLKSVYKGYAGTANDHQLGRTNDVGLVAGGLGIATFLAARRGATLPKHMEFIGLGSFLASMSLWPKIGVFGPARLVHGFDVDKRYIDDQGRNKSVFQDPNYVPFDLFDGRRKSENLNDIATYMGISKDAVNRDDMAKDQMVKIARQNNTLWMLSSGVAVPIMTALISNVAERAYTPYIFAQKSKKHDAELANLHKSIIEHAPLEESKKSLLDKPVSKIITNLSEQKIVTQAEIDKAIASATEGLNTDFASGFSREINKTLRDGNSSQVILDKDYISKLAKNLETKLQGHKHLKDAILSVDEIKAFYGGEKFAEGTVVDKAELLNKIKTASVAKLDPANKDVLSRRLETIISDKKKTILPESKQMVMTEEVKNILKTLAEPIETYAKKYKKIQSVNELQMGADSVNAHYWGKLEKAFTEIAIPTKSLKQLKGLMDNTPDITKQMVETFEKIAKDKDAFQKAVTSINDLKISYLTEVLGADKVGEYVDVVLGKSNAKCGLWQERGAGLNSNKVDKFIEMHRVIANDLLASIKSTTLKDGANSFTSIVSQLIPSQEAVAQVSRLENFVSACDRITHALDFYKRAELYKNGSNHSERVAQLGESGGLITPGWINELFEKGKRETIGATSNDVFLHFGFKDRPQMYQSFINLVYPSNGDFVYLNDATMDAMKPAQMSKIDIRLAEIEKALSKGASNSEKLIEERTSLNKLRNQLSEAHQASIGTLKSWISRYRNIIPEVWHNNGGGIAHEVDLNWLWAAHDVGEPGKYAFDKLLTPAAKYRIQAKNLVELADQGIKQVHNSNKWLRTFGSLFVGVFAASVATQFFFGKKDSTIPLEKDRIRNLKMAARAERMEATRAN